MKISELNEAALDWAVASAEGAVWAVWRFKERHTDGEMNYSTSWAQGGPIIEQERMELAHDGFVWWARIRADEDFSGHTPLVAAMRCFVASKLGDTIEVPEGL